MNEEELSYMLDEIAKTPKGLKALEESAKMISKFPLPEIKTSEVIKGGVPTQGIPFRVKTVQ